MSQKNRPEADSPTLSGEMLCPQCETGDLVLQGCARLCQLCGYMESCEENFAADGADFPRSLGSADEAGCAA